MTHFIYRGNTAFILALLLISLAAAPVRAADIAASGLRKVTFGEYLEAMEKHSLDLQNQRENITHARAGVSIAGVRPDPVLTAGIASTELYGPNKPNASTATTLGLAVTIETAGKRGRRILAAQSDVKLAEANVGAFLHDIQTQSAAAFVEACRTREALARKQSSLKSLQEVVGANEARLKAGDIGMLELRQSRVEADRFAADVASAAADARAAEINLSAFLGRRFDEVFPGRQVDSDLKRAPLGFELSELIRQALQNRDDIRVAKAALETAQANLHLTRANRWVDPTVNVGLTNTPNVGPIFDASGNVANSPAERSVALGLTVSIPIPFSRLQRGELTQAETALRQARLQLFSTTLKAETEVQAAYMQYRAAVLNVQSYVERVLKEADLALVGMRTSYRLGSASLLELLNARRTADDVYLGYLQTVADLANITVKLHISAGMRPDL